VDVWDGADVFEEEFWRGSNPRVTPEEVWFTIWVDAVGVVVAEANNGWRDLAEALKPGKEALTVGLGVDSIEIIDEVAWNEDVIWMF